MEKNINKKIKMQKIKHIKYTKLSLILSETVPFPVESPFCRTSPARRWLAIFSVMHLLCSWESPPSNLLKATRKPDVMVLLEIRG
jgi:hypothetical protein